MRANTLPSLRERAIRTLDDIETRFSLGGGFYRDKAGVDGAAFNWPLGILLSAYVAAARLDRTRYAPRVRALTDSLARGYWRADGPVGGYNASRTNGSGGTDRYYDDNAWLALAWAEAVGDGLGAAYSAAARRALAFCLSGHDTALGGGVWWHEKKEGKHTCSTAPVAVAALTVSGDTVTARRMYAWLRDTLRDPSDGLYWDALAASTGRLEKSKWSYNSALPLRLELLFGDLWGGREYRDRAARLTDVCLAHWFRADTGILTDDASFAHLLCEDLLRASSALGDRRARDAAFTSLDTLWTRVRRPDGWYPKRWDPADRTDSPTELLWIASAARAYAFAAAFQEGATRA